MPPADRDQPLAAIILAAGMSRRMGQPKSLLPLGNKPLVHHVIQTIRAGSSIAPIIIITGHRADEVAGSVECSIARFVHNPHHETAAMLSSIQLGLGALPAHTQAALIALGDQPLISRQTIASLIAEWMNKKPLAVLPAYDSHRGHPVLLDRRAFSQVIALTPDQTLKDFLNRHADEVVEITVPDPMIRFDVDTPEDYERARQIYQSLAANSAS